MPVNPAVALYLNGAWVDITADVRVDAGIQIRFGATAEGGTADASTCTLTVNNRDGRYSPRNPAGPYYGHLTRNTPLRVLAGAVEPHRFVGEVAEFPARWNLPGTDVWTPLVASGVLRRLVRTNALESTLRLGLRKIAAGGRITGYWPMEDAPGSTSFASVIAGVPRMSILSGSPVLGAVDPGVSSAPIPTWNAATAVANPRSASGTGFTVGFYLVVPASGPTIPAGAELLRFYTPGSAYLWIIAYDPGGGGQFLLRVFSNAGVEIHTQLLALGPLNGYPVFVKFEVATNGADADYYLDTYPGPGVGGTVAGGAVTGAPSGLYVGFGQALTEVGIGHVIVGDTSTALFTMGLDQALAGYAGETVGARMTRMADLAGVAMTVATYTSSTTDRLGPQPEGTPVEVMRAAEAADAGGILRDAINQVGLYYMPRAARYNANQPVLALNYAAGHLTPPLEPTDDDQNVRNDVTVTREGGSSARAVATSGPLNANPYPAGVGPYAHAVTLNLETDTQLPDVAAWLLLRGTLDETRWPVLTVDPVANPALETAVNAVRPGHRLTVSNLPAWVGPPTADLHVLGWTETINSHTRTVSFVCEPATGYRVLVLDDATYGVLDANNRLAL